MVGLPRGSIGDDAETLRVPVREEQVTAEKRVVVTEEISVGKQQVQDTERRVGHRASRGGAHRERWRRRGRRTALTPFSAIWRGRWLPHLPRASLMEVKSVSRRKRPQAYRVSETQTHEDKPDDSDKGREVVADAPSHTLEVREEQLVARKELREIGNIEIRTAIDHVPGQLEVDAYREEVVVEHEPVGEVVSQREEPWEEEDGTRVFPIYEEQLVVSRRLVLRERVRVRRIETTERQIFSDTLLRERLVVDDPAQYRPRTRDRRWRRDQQDRRQSRRRQRLRLPRQPRAKSARVTEPRPRRTPRVPCTSWTTLEELNACRHEHTHRSVRAWTSSTVTATRSARPESGSQIASMWTPASSASRSTTFHSKPCPRYVEVPST